MAKTNSQNSTQMAKTDASRIQSSTAKNNSGQVSKNSFAARAQRAATKNEK